MHRATNGRRARAHAAGALAALALAVTACGGGTAAPTTTSGPARTTLATTLPPVGPPLATLVAPAPAGLRSERTDYLGNPAGKQTSGDAAGSGYMCPKFSVYGWTAGELRYWDDGRLHQASPYLELLVEEFASARGANACGHDVVAIVAEQRQNTKHQLSGSKIGVVGVPGSSGWVMTVGDAKAPVLLHEETFATGLYVVILLSQGRPAGVLDDFARAQLARLPA